MKHWHKDAVQLANAVSWVLKQSFHFKERVIKVFFNEKEINHPKLPGGKMNEHPLVIWEEFWFFVKFLPNWTEKELIILPNETSWSGNDMNENMTPGQRKEGRPPLFSLSQFHLPIFQQLAIQEASGMCSLVKAESQKTSNEALIYLRLWNLFLSLITPILDLMITGSLFRCLCKTSNTDNSFCWGNSFSVLPVYIYQSSNGPTPCCIILDKWNSITYKIPSKFWRVLWKKHIMLTGDICASHSGPIQDYDAEQRTHSKTCQSMTKYNASWKQIKFQSQSSKKDFYNLLQMKPIWTTFSVNALLLRDVNDNYKIIAWRSVNTCHTCSPASPGPWGRGSLVNVYLVKT